MPWFAANPPADLPAQGPFALLAELPGRPCVPHGTLPGYDKALFSHISIIASRRQYGQHRCSVSAARLKLSSSLSGLPRLTAERCIHTLPKHLRFAIEALRVNLE
jgi:hypothetical protein